MRFKSVIHCTIAIGIAYGTAACMPRATMPTGPGCLIQIYTLTNLKGYGLPIMQDTPEFAPAWHDAAESAKVVYGTWRLYADADYKGFMGDYTAPADVLQLIPSHKLASLKCIRAEPPPPQTPY